MILIPNNQISDPADKKGHKHRPGGTGKIYVQFCKRKKKSGCGTQSLYVRALWIVDEGAAGIVFPEHFIYRLPELHHNVRVKI